MLNIKVQTNQEIYIGDDATLKVLKIDASNDEVLLQLVQDKLVHDFTMVIGKSARLIPKVAIHFMTINTVGLEYAMLGFEAPRDIKINGSWETGNRKHAAVTRKGLVAMSDKTLVYYASNNVKSILEHELLTRLKGYVGRPK